MRDGRHLALCGRLLGVAGLLLSLTPPALAVCVGDCNSDGMVTIDELILGVRIALGSEPASACPAFANGEGVVDIAQLIAGVNNALNGCPGGPTPTPRQTSTSRPTATATAKPSRLLQTGQTSSYGPGSDGDLRKGVARSFTDNGDGTITDNVTGLMWEKKSNDGSIHDVYDVYSWAPLLSDSATMNGDMVTTFLAALNAGGGFAGHADWRIPNVFELESLVDLERVEPATSPAFNTGCTPGCTVTACSCTGSRVYWSSTTAWHPDPLCARYVSFSDGTVWDTSKGRSLAAVRAVRGGS